jgi:hypothetical protein
VLSGDLKDAIFAADIGDVISTQPGTPNVYGGVGQRPESLATLGTACTEAVQAEGW